MLIWVNGNKVWQHQTQNQNLLQSSWTHVKCVTSCWLAHALPAGVILSGVHHHEHKHVNLIPKLVILTFSVHYEPLNSDWFKKCECVVEVLFFSCKHLCTVTFEICYKNLLMSWELCWLAPIIWPLCLSRCQCCHQREIKVIRISCFDLETWKMHVSKFRQRGTTELRFLCWKPELKLNNLKGN